jgi:photosynthetic reaction center cytochrome c subunit
MATKVIVRSCVAILVVFLLTILVIVPAKTSLFAGTPEQGKPQEKTVEQVKKNILVLKGLPASQLNMVMDYMATSLGVRCNHCHVADSTGWYMEKDDKPEKRTARKMIEMVIDLNTNRFGGRSAVTCYTCHRGSVEPSKLIPLPQPPAKPEVEESEAVPSFPAVDQVLAKYESALGGADALKKINTRLMKGVAVDLQGKESPIEIAQQAPDNYLVTVTGRGGMLMSRGFNGSSAWMSSPRGARELPPEENDNMKRDGAMFPLGRMRSLATSLHITNVDTVNGAAAYVLSSPAGEHNTERYYVDSSSGLLLRRVVITSTMIGDIPEQVDYSDYRTIDGVKVPFTVRLAAVDPRDTSTRRFTSVEQNVKIEENKFAMPKGK